MSETERGRRSHPPAFSLSAAVAQAGGDAVQGQQDALADARVGVAGAPAADQLDLYVIERLDIGHAQADQPVQLGLADRIHGAIVAEWDKTGAAVLAITGQDALLAGQPELDRLIRLRLPYVEPLNHVQIELIRRRRAGDDDPRVREGILLSLNGVAAGLRNSG